MAEHHGKHPGARLRDAEHVLWGPSTRRSAAIAFGIIVAIFGAADLFGVFDIFAALTAGEDSEEQRVSALMVFLGSLFALVVVGHAKIEKEIRILREDLSDPYGAEWQLRVEESMDPLLFDLYAKELRAMSAGVQSAVVERQIVLEEQPLMPRFRASYVETLRNFPGCEFWATSLAKEAWFWSRDDQHEGDHRDITKVEKEFERFLRPGTGEVAGIMHRLFFVDSLDRLTDEEAGILSRQIDIGVKVRIAKRGALGIEQERLFVVEDQGRIAWEAYPDAEDRIHRVLATVDRKVIETEYLALRDLLFGDGGHSREVSKPMIRKLSEDG